MKVTKSLLESHNLRVGEEGWTNSVSAKSRTVDFAVAQKDAEIACGGSALNTLRVAKLKAPEAEVFMIGRVGVDPHGKLIEQTCLTEGLNCTYLQRDKDTHTGICAILVEENTRDRSIVCLRGAAANLSLQEALSQSSFQKLLQSHDTIVFATSYNLTTPHRAEFIEHVFRTAEGTLALSLSAGSMLANVKSYLDALLPKCSLLFANAREAMTWAQLNKRPTDSLLVCTEFLASHLKSGGCAVVTNGAEPSFFCVAQGNGVEVLPNVVDTINGDTNGAGIIYSLKQSILVKVISLRQGMPLQEVSLHNSPNHKDQAGAL